LNLLQPQDRRSKQPGDTVAAVAARRRLHDRGVTAPLLDGIRAAAGVATWDVALDVGCGDGFYLGNLGCEGHGVDISVTAVEAAAKRFPQWEWVVANADRFVPWADGSFSLVLSITGRMNPGEFRRVLKEDGRLLVAVAAPDDLIELRGKGKDRVHRTVAEFAQHFRLIERGNVSTTADLDEAAIEDVLASIYRPLHNEPIEAKRLTFSLDLLLFGR
jgi:23S rRNA (guanine745-N1)-methyltransferase